MLLQLQLLKIMNMTKKIMVAVVMDIVLHFLGGGGGCLFVCFEGVFVLFCFVFVSCWGFFLGGGWGGCFVFVFITSRSKYDTTSSLRHTFT